MKAIALCACLFLALGAAWSVGLMEMPFEMMNGADPGALAENIIGRYTTVISLLSAGLLASVIWGVMLARKSAYLSCLLSLAAAGSVLYPIALQWKAFQKMRDLMASPGVDVLDPEIVSTLFFAPAKAAIWTGLGAITLIGASGFFSTTAPRSGRQMNRA